MVILPCLYVYLDVFICIPSLALPCVSHSTGQALWSPDDLNPLRSPPHNNTATTALLNFRPPELTLGARQITSNVPIMDRVVGLTARLLAMFDTVPAEEEEVKPQQQQPTVTDRPTHDCHSGWTRASTVAQLSQVALKMGLSCTNQHHANRCLQIFRILGAQLDSKKLSDLIFRLGETIADTNEEFQVVLSLWECLFRGYFRPVDVFF